MLGMRGEQRQEDAVVSNVVRPAVVCVEDDKKGREDGGEDDVRQGFALCGSHVDTLHMSRLPRLTRSSQSDAEGSILAGTGLSQLDGKCLCSTIPSFWILLISKWIVFTHYVSSHL